MTTPISEQTDDETPVDPIAVNTDGPERTKADPDQPPAIPSNKNTLSKLLGTVALWLLFSIVLPLIPYQSKRMLPYSLSFVRWIIHMHLPSRLAWMLIHMPSAPEYLERMTVFHFIPSLPFLILQILIGYRIVRMGWTVRTNAKILVTSIIIWFMLLPIDVYISTHHGKFFTVLAHITPLLFNLALTFGFSCIGVLLSKIVREPNVLLPVAVVAMPIDYVGAMTPVGFTNTMVERHPHAVSQVMVHVPHLAGLSLESMIGPGDILFIAFFLAAIERLNMNLRGTLFLLFGLLSLTLLEVIVIGFPVAALVPMGIAVVCANFRCFKLKREEVFAMIYAGIVVFAVVGVFYYYAHRVLVK